MEFLKDIIVDFVLFSGIEGLIFCLFFEKIGGCRKFKWYEWLILSVGNCLISKLLPPTIYQCVCVVWMAFLLKELNKDFSIIKILKIVISSLLMFYIIEIIYSILIEVFSNKDLILYGNKFIVFIYLIPTKIIEFIICLKGEQVMKIVVGGVVRK